MKELLRLNCEIDDILSANGDELRSIINKALKDLVGDTYSRYKDPSDKRTLVINLDIARLGNEGVYIAQKITPKPAPYNRRPEALEPEVVDGQVSLDDIAEEAEEQSKSIPAVDMLLLSAPAEEVDEDDQEVDAMIEDADEDEKRRAEEAKRKARKRKNG